MLIMLSMIILLKAAEVNNLFSICFCGKVGHPSEHFLHKPMMQTNVRLDVDLEVCFNVSHGSSDERGMWMVFIMWNFLQLYSVLKNLVHSPHLECLVPVTVCLLVFLSP